MFKPALLFLATTAVAVSVTYRQPIEFNDKQPFPAEGSYVAVSLTPEVYEKAKINLSDLRILDNAQNPVPYVLLSEELSQSEKSSIAQVVQEEQMEVSLSAVGSRREKTRDVYDFEVLKNESKDVVLSSLFVKQDTAEDYLFKTEVWGSYDGKSFEPIQNANLYQVGTHTAYEIQFKKPQNYWFYRIVTNQPYQAVVALEAKGMVVTQETLGAGEGLVTEKLSAESVKYTPQYSIKEDKKQTIVNIKDVANLPMTHLNVLSNDVYKRSVSLYMISGEERRVIYNGDISRFFLDKSELIHLPILLDVLSRTYGSYDSLELVIENEDNAPIHIGGIEVEYIREYAVFKALPAISYTLNYGDPELLTPSYDLASVEKNLNRKISGIAALGILQEVRLESKQMSYLDKNSQMFLFNGAILVAGLVLGFVSFRAIKGLNKGK